MARMASWKMAKKLKKFWNVAADVFNKVLVLLCRFSSKFLINCCALWSGCIMQRHCFAFGRCGWSVRSIWLIERKKTTAIECEQWQLGANEKDGEIKRWHLSEFAAKYLKIVQKLFKNPSKNPKILQNLSKTFTQGRKIPQNRPKFLKIPTVLQKSFRISKNPQENLHTG